MFNFNYTMMKLDIYATLLLPVKVFVIKVKQLSDKSPKYMGYIRM